MKNLNSLIVKYLKSVIFVYIVENTIFIKKLRNIIEHILNIAFVTYTAFEKKDINLLQKYIIFDIKRLVYKSFA